MFSSTGKVEIGSKSVCLVITGHRADTSKQSLFLIVSLSPGVVRRRRLWAGGDDPLQITDIARPSPDYNAKHVRSSLHRLARRDASRASLLLSASSGIEGALGPSLVLSSTTTPSCPPSRTSHSSATPQPATALPVQLASLSKLLQRNPPAPAAPPAQLASLPKLSQRCNKPAA